MNLKRCNYFITGGAGFIGSNLINYLNSTPFDGLITIYDNFSNGSLGYIDSINDMNNIRVIKGDLLNLELLSKSMPGHDIVIHFAANADISLSASSTSLDLNQTVIATYNVLETMRNSSVNKIIYSSGSGVYGNIGYTIAAEDYSPLHPVSMYGATKLSAESLICAFSNLYEINAYIYRFANVVGKNQTHGVAYDFIKRLKQDSSKLRILGNGLQSKPYIHVDDVIKAIFHTADFRQNNDITIYNVSTLDAITVRDIAEIVASEMMINPEMIYQEAPIGWPGDVPVVRLDSSKLRQTGWSNQLNSRDSIILSVKQMLHVGN